MLSAIIFDIDGTLIDSNDFHAHAWQQAFREHGKHILLQLIQKHIGEGADQLLPHFLTKAEIDKWGDAIKQSQKKIFHASYISKVKPFPKVRELFQNLRAKHVRIALATSSEKKEVEAFKEIADIADLVDRSTSADEVEKSKPHPALLDAAMSALGNPPRGNVLFIGDSPYDVIASARARLPFAGVLCGGFTPHELKLHGCHEVYQDPADILHNLQGVLNRGIKPRPAHH